MIEDMIKMMEASTDDVLISADDAASNLYATFATFAASEQICRDLGEAFKNSDARLESRFLKMARRLEDQQIKMQSKLAAPPNVFETMQARKKLEAVMNIGAFLTLAGK